ncbi:MAG: site-2 protease family protein [Chloroflexi bacterium]|nr:site-2 protease family protein [Chloroflexota bacterium]
MGTSVRLGRILGIPFGLNYSWFIIFTLVTVSMASQFRVFHPFWSVTERWGVALGTSLLFFLSVVGHELAHSLVATKKGIPVKGITLFVFGGVAQISREATRPATELAIAIVGPLSSIIFGLLFWALFFLLRPVNEHLAAMAEVLFPINIALGVFNMVPGFPLDGGRVLRAAIWGISHNYRVATRIATLLGHAIAIALIIAGVIIAVVFDNFLQGMWLSLIGWFLNTAAIGTHRQHRLREGLRQFVARDIMSLDYPSVTPEDSLRELADNKSLLLGRRIFMVTQDGKIVGIATLEGIKGVPRRKWEVTQVKHIMLPLGTLQAVEVWEEAFRVLEILDEGKTTHVVVIQNGNVIGLISKENIVHFVRTREELRL